MQVSPRRIASLSTALLALGALGIAPQAMAESVPVPPPLPPDAGSVPPGVVQQATLDRDRLAITVGCTRDGDVTARLSSRSSATASFKCADGTAVARMRVPSKLSARVRGGRVRISVRDGKKTVTRTIKVGAPRAKLSAWIHGGPHGSMDASGSCNVYYGFSGLLNSAYAGDRQHLRFKMYVDGIGWTGWTTWTAYYVRQAPGTTYVTRSPFYMQPLGTRWVTVLMELYSEKAGRSWSDYLITQRVGGDLTQTDGIWCRNLI